MRGYSPTCLFANARFSQPVECANGFDCNTTCLFSFQIMKKLIPCSFVTPLDCFWEGSKLLGPEFPVHMP